MRSFILGSRNKPRAVISILSFRSFDSTSLCSSREAVTIEILFATPSPPVSRDWLALQQGRDGRYTRGTDLIWLEEKHGNCTRKTGGGGESACPTHGDGRDAHHTGLATHP